jgi:hypothetical protein
MKSIKKNPVRIWPIINIKTSSCPWFWFYHNTKIWNIFISTIQINANLLSLKFYLDYNFTERMELKWTEKTNEWISNPKSKIMSAFNKVSFKWHTAWLDNHI